MVRAEWNSGVSGSRDTLDGFSQRFFRDALRLQVLDQPRDRCGFQFLQIGTQPLADVGAHQRLVAGETEHRCNALQVVESFGTDRVLCIPDEFLAKNIAKQTKVKILTWKGHCEVHERFTAEELRQYRKDDPNIVIIAHPECPPEVVEEADFSGSTSGMINWVKEHQPKRVVMVTECSMSDNVAVENPNVEFVRPCNLCPHMKRISLKNILESLVYMREEVTVDPAVAVRARAAVERMINLGN